MGVNVKIVQGKEKHFKKNLLPFNQTNNLTNLIFLSLKFTSEPTQLKYQNYLINFKNKLKELIYD